MVETGKPFYIYASSNSWKPKVSCKFC